jgi:hypothetical protein
MSFENVFDLEKDFKVVTVKEKDRESEISSQQEEELEGKPASFRQEENPHGV